jgi:hypothetical protein
MVVKEVNFMKSLKITAGVLMLIGSVWVGAYGIHSLSEQTQWMEFPILITSILLGVVGYGWASWEMIAK